MKRIFTLIICCIYSLNFIQSQTLVDSFSFEFNTQLNSFWGITSIGDKLYLGADGAGDIYEVSQTGDILNTISTASEIDFNHGMVWDGNGFWIAENFTSSGASLFNVDINGNTISSFVLPPIIGGNSAGVGGLAMDGPSIWYSVYFPDFDDYPYNYAYLIKPNETNHSDTIPLYGKQVYGMAVKGDTIFYVTDDLDGDEERIYAYSKTLEDTLYSFPLLDPDGDSSPRGLHWDGNHLWLIAKRPGGAAFAHSMLYKYEIESPIPMFPEMDLSVDVINFDTVFLGAQKSQGFYIRNTGDADLSIDELMVDNLDFSVDSPNLPFSIAVGDSSWVEITFAPSQEIVYNNQLNIGSDAQNDPDQSIALNGTGALKVGTPAALVFKEIKIFPNPAYEELNLNLHLIKPLSISIELVDALGKRSASFLQNQQLAGEQQLNFNLQQIPSGNYFLVLKMGAELLKTIPLVVE